MFRLFFIVKIYIFQQQKIVLNLKLKNQKEKQKTKNFTEQFYSFV